MSSVDLVLSPRDGLHFKDGRGWQSSVSGRAHALSWPFPSTLLGALRTAWGRQLEVTDPSIRLDRVSWPIQTQNVSLAVALPLRRPFGQAAWRPDHRMWPVPHDALQIEGEAEVLRLDPREPIAEVETLGTESARLKADEARERLWRPALPTKEKPTTLPRWWTDGDMMSWLVGGVVLARTAAEAAPFDLPRRLQVHVGIDSATLTCREGVLFSAEIQETLAAAGTGGATQRLEWAIGLRGEAPGIEKGLASTPFTLGGDAKLARPEMAAEPLFDPPAAVIEAFRTGAPGLRLVVVTPAWFGSSASSGYGWLPDGFDLAGDRFEGDLPGVNGRVVLRAAFVGRPLHVSGWDMAGDSGDGKPCGRPKATRRLVPPGSVYFLHKVDGTTFTADEAAALWLASLGGAAKDGFGRVVPGIWPAASQD